MTSPSTDDQQRVLEEAAGRVRQEMRAIERMAYLARLCSFRSYLGVAIRCMSPLVPPILELSGTDVPSMLERLRPARDWQRHAGKEGSIADRAMWLPSFKVSAGGKRHTLRQMIDPYHLPSRVGDATVSDGPPTGWVQLVAVGRGLEILARLPGFDLSTAAGAAHVSIRDRLPESIVSACPGRCVDAIVDHGIFREREYRIVRAWQDARRFNLEFEAESLPLRMPWRD